MTGESFGKDAALLTLRILPNILMAWLHGAPKLVEYQEKSVVFPDPLGVGPAVSLGLVIFAELFCAILVAIGFCTRLALVPLIVTFGMAAFVIHGHELWTKGELALIYLIIYLALFLSGPGRYSIDQALFGRKN